MKYKYLIFDMDDTLIDNKENVKYAFKKMVDYLNKEYSDELFNDWYYFDIQFWDDYKNGLIEVPEDYLSPRDLYVAYVQSLRYIKFFNNELSISEALKVNDLFLNNLKEVVIEVKGAEEVLKELSSKYKIVIATNGPSQAVYTKIDKIGCSDYIYKVFAADMTENTVTKPNPLYFMELCKYLDEEDKSKMLVIGDSIKTDVEGAINSKIDSCWFNRDNKDIESNATYVIKELKDLLDIL